MDRSSPSSFVARPSEGGSALLDRVRSFVDREILPLERAFLQGSFRDLLPELGALRDKVRQEGLWAPCAPKEMGGLGLSLSEFAPLSEVLGRTPLGHYVFNCQAPDVGNMELLAAHGSDEQKATYLRPLVEGKIRSCFSMTEPDFPGSNPVWLGTTATRDGDGYVLRGRKWFTSSADGASFAIVMAVTSKDAAAAHKRASMFVVPTTSPGFRIVRNLPVMGHAGEDYATHAEVDYDDVRVSESQRIGVEGQGFALAQERLGPGRIHHCMRWIGIAERAFSLACQRAVSRLLSPGVPLAAQPTIQHWLAEDRTAIDAARLLVLDTLRILEGEGAKAARNRISMIKFHVAGVLGQVLDHAIQIHGALGLTDETPLAYWYRHERGARIYDGPDEVHKGAVGRRILQAYGYRPTGEGTQSP